MSIDLVMRFIGLLVFGLGGFYLGQAWYGRAACRCKTAWRRLLFPFCSADSSGLWYTLYYDPALSRVAAAHQADTGDRSDRGHHGLVSGVADCRFVLVPAIISAVAVSRDPADRRRDRVSPCWA